MNTSKINFRAIITAFVAAIVANVIIWLALSANYYRVIYLPPMILVSSWAILFALGELGKSSKAKLKITHSNNTRALIISLRSLSLGWQFLTALIFAIVYFVYKNPDFLAIYNDFWYFLLLVVSLILITLKIER
jgi:hypothetical protein